MNYLCTIEETKTQPVISMRIITKIKNLFLDLEKASTSLMDHLNQLGEKTSGPFFAAYYNWNMEKLDVEIGFPVRKIVPGNGLIMANEIPPGKKATTLYKGPYRKIAPAYKALSEYIQENGYKPGINYEFYYNSMKEVPENELVTKIVYILK